MNPYKWDLFLAYADGDADQIAAERLHDLIGGRARVFLRSRSLQLGDIWDDVLPRAQRESLITVVLISANTDRAWYAREEIAAALELAQRDGRRVVPVFLGPRRDEVPHGLRRVHAAQVRGDADLPSLADQLVDLVRRQAPLGGAGPLPAAPAASTAAPPAQAPAPHPAELGVPVFVLAADADRAQLEELRKHLYLAQKQKILYLYTKDGEPGEDRARALSRLSQVPLIVLLVSANLFINHDAQIDTALSRYGAGARVVPILLSDYGLEGSRLKDLVALPRENGAIARWRDKDAAWAHVARELRRLAESLAPTR